MHLVLIGQRPFLTFLEFSVQQLCCRQLHARQPTRFPQATFVSMDTEDPFAPGTEQWAWVNATLAAVDRSVTPWLFLVLHR